MATATAIAAIRTGMVVELGAHKVLTTSASVATAAKYPDIIYEILILHQSAKIIHIGGVKAIWLKGLQNPIFPHPNFLY